MQTILDGTVQDGQALDGDKATGDASQGSLGPGGIYIDGEVADGKGESTSTERRSVHSQRLAYAFACSSSMHACRLGVAIWTQNWPLTNC